MVAKRFDFNSELPGVKAAKNYLKQMEKISNYSFIATLKEHQDRLNKSVKLASIQSIPELQNKANSIHLSRLLEASNVAELHWKKILAASANNVFKEHQEKIKNFYNTHIFTSIIAQEKKLQTLQFLSSNKILEEHVRRLEDVYKSPVSKIIKENDSRWKEYFREPVKEAVSIAQAITSNEAFDDEYLSTFVDEADQFISDLYDETQEKNNVSSLSFEGYVQIILSLVLFLFAHSLSYESDSLMMSKIDNLEAEISRRFEDLNKSGEEGTFYIVKRPVNVRSVSHAGSDTEIIDILYPNQRVQLLRRDKKWIYVSYFDFIANFERKGWVNKKYLIMQE